MHVGTHRYVSLQNSIKKIKDIKDVLHMLRITIDLLSIGKLVYIYHLILFNDIFL